MKLICPRCQKDLVLPDENNLEKLPFFPFCSQRCKLIDLGAWLDDQYKIPAEPDEQGNEQ